MDHFQNEAARTPTMADPTSHKKPSKTNPAGLTVDEVFCPVEAADPFETVQWEMRTAAIKGEGGEVVFEQRDCEIPATWTQLATNVVVSKYFYGEVTPPNAKPACGN